MLLHNRMKFSYDDGGRVYTVPPCILAERHDVTVLTSVHTSPKPDLRAGRPVHAPREGIVAATA